MTELPTIRLCGHFGITPGLTVIRLDLDELHAKL
jgi:hypothetical protein